jgi:hypothetical protein
VDDLYRWLSTDRGRRTTLYLCLVSAGCFLMQRHSRQVVHSVSTPPVPDMQALPVCFVACLNVKQNSVWDETEETVSDVLESVLQSHAEGKLQAYPS